MKHKFRIILLCVTLVVAVGAFFIFNMARSSDDDVSVNERASEVKVKQGRGADRSTPVMVYVADYVRLDEGVRAVGTLLPNEEVDIASEATGKVDQITFEEGMPVRRGALLVKVNDDDLQSQLKRATFQRNMLREKLERNRILLDRDAISREAFDQIETDYNMVEADIQLLNVRIDKTEIKAPFDGVIGFRYVSLGSYIQPNSQVAHLVDRSKLKVEFSIPEKYHKLVGVGSTVSFSTEGNDNSYTAKIYAIDSKVDAKTRTVTMRALFDNRSASLLPGMFAAVTVGQKTGNVIQLPTEAIVPDVDRKKVWLVRDGLAVGVPVVTGVRSENMVEITSGINRGDSVIITGLMQIKENSKVQVTN